MTSCVSTGGYPPPKLTLTLGSLDLVDMSSFSYWSELTGQRGLRIMDVTSERTAADTILTVEDDGAELKCVVEIPGLPPVSVTTVSLVFRMLTYLNSSLKTS